MVNILPNIISNPPHKFTSIAKKHVILFHAFCFNAFFTLLPLNSDGQNMQWSKQFQFNTQDFVGGINCDSLNNIYLGGAIRRVYTSMNGFYRVKIDPTGNLIWSDTTNLLNTSYPIAFAGDKSGNSYIGGESSQNFKVGDSVINYPSTGWNGFLVKLNSNNVVLWTQAFSKAVPTSIVRKTNNSIYICGRATASSQLDGINLPPGAFIAKFNSFG